MRRSERKLRLQRYAALLAALFSFLLLLPELTPSLEMLATLALAVVELGGELWLALVLLVMSVAYALARQKRNTGLLRRR